MESNYGSDSDWAEPNEHGESGFTLAQVETDIGESEVACLIQQGINRDREQVRLALSGRRAVPGFRKHHLSSVTDLLSAYEEFNGDLSDFTRVWSDYMTGKDFPCPSAGDGIHDVTDGVCTDCGDVNRG